MSRKTKTWDYPNDVSRYGRIENFEFFDQGGRESIFVLASPQSAVVSSDGFATIRMEPSVKAKAAWGQHAMAMLGGELYVNEVEGTPNNRVATYVPGRSNSLHTIAGALAENTSNVWGYDFSGDHSKMVAYSDRDLVVTDLQKNAQISYLWANGIGEVLVRAQFLGGSSNNILLPMFEGLFLWNPNNKDPEKIFSVPSFFVTDAVATPDGQLIIVAGRNNGTERSFLALLRVQQ